MLHEASSPPDSKGANGKKHPDWGGYEGLPFFTCMRGSTVRYLHRCHLKSGRSKPNYITLRSAPSVSKWMQRVVNDKMAKASNKRVTPPPRPPPPRSLDFKKSGGYSAVAGLPQPRHNRYTCTTGTQRYSSIQRRISSSIAWLNSSSLPSPSGEAHRVGCCEGIDPVVRGRKLYDWRYCCDMIYYDIWVDMSPFSLPTAFLFRVGHSGEWLCIMWSCIILYLTHVSLAPHSKLDSQ